VNYVQGHMIFHGLDNFVLHCGRLFFCCRIRLHRRNDGWQSNAVETSMTVSVRLNLLHVHNTLSLSSLWPTLGLLLRIPINCQKTGIAVCTADKCCKKDRRERCPFAIFAHEPFLTVLMPLQPLVLDFFWFKLSYDRHEWGAWYSNVF